MTLRILSGVTYIQAGLCCGAPLGVFAMNPSSLTLASGVLSAFAAGYSLAMVAGARFYVSRFVISSIPLAG